MGRESDYRWVQHHTWANDTGRWWRVSPYTPVTSASNHESTSVSDLGFSDEVTGILLRRGISTETDLLSLCAVDIAVALVPDDVVLGTGSGDGAIVAMNRFEHIVSCLRRKGKYPRTPWPTRQKLEVWLSS